MYRRSYQEHDTFPVFGQAADKTGADKCATADIMLSSGTVSPGESIGIFTKVTNCGAKRASFAVKVSVTDACGQVPVVVLDTDPADGKTSGSFWANIGYRVPNEACPGTYTVIAIVSSNNGVQILTTTRPRPRAAGRHKHCCSQ